MDNTFQDYKISINENGDVIILPFDGKYEYFLLFIHGLAYEPITYLRTFLSEPLKSATKKFKIVIPKAPVRKVTSRGIETISWFDIKTYENSFDRPFEEAFSGEEIKDSFNRLKPIIENEAKLLNGDYKKIFLSGFSQGCGMSIYTAYGLEHDVAGVIGVAGYFFEITNYNKERNIPILTVHGLKDDLRVWSEVKKSYEKFQGSDAVKLGKEMAHEINSIEPRQYFADFLLAHTKL